METDSAGAVVAHNLYGTNLISRDVQGEAYYYLYNAHGDVVMLMNAETGRLPERIDTMRLVTFLSKPEHRRTVSLMRGTSMMRNPDFIT